MAESKVLGFSYGAWKPALHSLYLQTSNISEWNEKVIVKEQRNSQHSQGE